MNATVDVTTIRIETPRLILRPWRETDLQDFYEYASVDGVGELAGWRHHGSVEESRTILNSFIRHKKTFALVLKETGKVIGSLGLEELDPDPVEGTSYGREIGYVLSKNHWGCGLMTEAVQAVIRYCFETLDFDYLTCGHFVGNHRSQRVIEKCGFTYTGTSDYQTRYGTVERSRNYILYNPHNER